MISETDSIKGVLQMYKKMKDIALAKGLQVAINRYIKEYGEMSQLDLNSEEKTIDMVVMLDGEKDSLAVRVNRYEITERDGEHMLVIHDVETSRAWINHVASAHLEGKSFLLPEKYAKMVKAIL